MREATRFFADAIERKVLPEAGITPTPGLIPRLADRLATAYVHRAAEENDAAARALDEVLGLLPEERRPLARGKFEGFLAAAVRGGATVAQGFDDTRRDFTLLLRSDDATRESFVAEYEYDISPCRDDRPFFFNYYRYAGLFKKRDPQRTLLPSQERYHPDFPVGHMVLLASLLQILLLAFVLIFSPIRHLRRTGVATPGKWRFLTYFTALGLGFMLIEIALMQKLVIFLGHPTYALSVVLAAMLAFAGVGSLLSGRIPRLSRPMLYLLLLLIVGTTLGVTWWCNHRLGDFLGWRLGARIAMTVVLLMPLGLALGTAFPSGIRIVRSRCPDLLPWCWAVNGFLSVFASLFAIVLAMVIGFTNVIYVAAGIYVLGFIVMTPERASDDSGDAVAAPVE